MNSSVCPTGKKKKKNAFLLHFTFSYMVNPENFKINDLLCSCLDELYVKFWKNAATTCTCIHTLPSDVITFSLFMPEIPGETALGDTAFAWWYK